MGVRTKDYFHFLSDKAHLFARQIAMLCRPLPSMTHATQVYELWQSAFSPTL
jgi:hypothetical protein